jgi:hypothetical protein
MCVLFEYRPDKNRIDHFSAPACGSFAGIYSARKAHNAALGVQQGKTRERPHARSADASVAASAQPAFPPPVESSWLGYRCL